jgi:hypothetical protein
VIETTVLRLAFNAGKSRCGQCPIPTTTAARSPSTDAITETELGGRPKGYVASVQAVGSRLSLSFGIGELRC